MFCYSYAFVCVALVGILAGIYVFYGRISFLFLFWVGSDGSCPFISGFSFGIVDDTHIYTFLLTSISFISFNSTSCLIGLSATERGSVLNYVSIPSAVKAKDCRTQSVHVTTTVHRFGAQQMPLPRALAHLKRGISERKWAEAKRWVLTEFHRCPTQKVVPGNEMADE